MSDSNELALTLSNLQDFIPATMSLYDGRLVKTDTELFFIAERFSGWEIMERCELDDVQKVELKESFMGRVVEIHTSGSHWSLKELPEGISIDQWLNGSNQLITEPQSTRADINADDQEASVTDNHLDERSENSINSATQPTVVPSLDVINEPSSKTQTDQNTIYPQSDNPQVNELRQILIDQPNLQAKVHQAVGKNVDPLDEDVLSLFMRRHIQSYLQVRIASGEVLSPFEMLNVVQTQMKANPGGELALKIIKGFIVVWVVMFVLPFVFGILSALVSIISILF